MAVNDYGIEIQKEPEMVMIPIADYEAEKMRLQELESENKKLEAEIEMDAKKQRIMVNGYNRKCERVKELEAENAKLKVELEHARSYKRRIKMRSRNLQAENEKLKGELQQSATNCNKLKCLALHAMIGYAANEYNYYREYIGFGFGARKCCEIWKAKIEEYREAYRKAKKALMEGK